MEDVNQSIIRSDLNTLSLLHICVAIDPEWFALLCIEHLLFDNDIDINRLARVDGHLMTSGHIAVEWQRYRVLQRLVDSGIDLFLCDSYGLTVEEYAIKKNDTKALLIIKTALKKCQCITSRRTSSNLWNSCSEQSVKASSLTPINQSKNESVLEQTIIYFDDVLAFDSSDGDSSDNTLKSNISYEKMDSIRSCGSDRTEVYVYNDKDHNVVLIEERFEAFPEMTCVHPSDHSVVSKGCATESDSERLLAAIEAMNSTAIYNELRQWGDSSPPITASTKRVCARRLLRYRRGQLSAVRLPLPGYSDQLNRLVNDHSVLSDAQRLDQRFSDLFEGNGLKNRFFNYLLRDPNIVENIALKANEDFARDGNRSSEMKWFSTFVRSIFYVGKGRGDRIYEHFYQSVKAQQKGIGLDKSSDKTKENPKVKRIVEIWRSGKGVISLPCFHSSGSDEALARESLIIEALGVTNLTNSVIGSNVRQLRRNCFKSEANRQLYGSYLLYKAFQMTLVSAERQIRPRL